MRKNVRTPTPARKTHEGAKAVRTSVMQDLRRALMSCMLFEDTFYESGTSISDRINELTAQAVKQGKAAELGALAIQARTEYKLRHAPLHLCVALSRAHALRASTLVGVIQRADELGEFLALYWEGGKVPLSRQVKLGLAWAFRKFDAYSLAKYNSQNAKVALRDVLFLSHAKPADKKQAATWKQLVDGTLPSPDTWEVALSAGANKKETFLRLMGENKLYALAFLRNLRNMEQSGISKADLKVYADALDVSRVLPFRFIAAARAVPQWEDFIEPMMLRAMEAQEKLPGKTVVLIDVSGSMDAAMSGKSDLRRVDAANGVAILAASICEDVEIFSFSNSTVRVPTRKGFALADAIKNSQSHGGTYLGKAIRDVSGKYDRLIVITDEQSQDPVGAPDKGSKAYLINVAPYQNGVGYGPWVHIDGFSEAVVDYIRQYENQKD